MDSNNIVIRPVGVADRTAVMALAPRLLTGVAPWRDPDKVLASIGQWLESSLADDNDGRALVATVDDRVVGFVSLSTTTHFTGEIDAYIGELMVDEAFAGRGVGRALVEAVEQAAVEQRFQRISLTTGAANDGALAFYDRLGYRAEDVNLVKVLAPTSIPPCGPDPGVPT